MPLYEYTARDVTGKVLAGAIEAESDATVTQKLREMGFFITNLQRKSAPVGVGEWFAKFKSATTYPVLLATAAIGALLFMTVVIIPQFASFFKELGSNAQLPLPTQIAMGVSTILRKFWYLIIAALGGTLYALRTYVKTP